MHVFGWPITAKVANLEWKKRNMHKEWSQRRRNVDVKPPVGPSKDFSGQSYTEIVKEAINRDDNTKSSGIQKKERMYWDNGQCDTSWLEFSVVRVLKSFSDISKVIKDMLNRKIYFNFYYLGDKNVLWTFRSKKYMDEFTRNKTVWRDFFSSVGGWSAAITPQSRLSWVEFRGIPLDCWCEDFFKRLGWAIGEPLMIEKDTLDRSNLVSGRVLVLIPYNHKCPQVVKVDTRRSSFLVSIWEDPTPIGYSNILGWLGLDWEENDGVSSFGTENGKEGEKAVGNHSTNHSNLFGVSGDRLKALKTREAVEDWVEERSADFRLENVTKNNDEQRIICSKGKGIMFWNPKQPVKRPIEFKEVLRLDNNKGDCWNSSFEESNRDRMGFHQSLEGKVQEGDWAS
jgi:hypothetical protein